MIAQYNTRPFLIIGKIFLGLNSTIILKKKAWVIGLKYDQFLVVNCCYQLVWSSSRPKWRKVFVLHDFNCSKMLNDKRRWFQCFTIQCLPIFIPLIRARIGGKFWKIHISRNFDISRYFDHACEFPIFSFKY